MGDFTLEHENHNKLKAGGVVNYIVHRHLLLACVKQFWDT
jgi:hypothetical protein